MVTNWLEETYPDADMTMIKVAIGSAGSQWGAYSVSEDVLSHDPDLVFVEFAVNDNICAGEGKYDAEKAKLYYETIIRKIHEASPQCDIVALYTTNG